MRLIQYFGGLWATWCVAAIAPAAQDFPEPANSSAIRSVLRAVEGETDAIIHLRHDTIDLILRAPALFSPSRISSIFPDEPFRSRNQEEDRSGINAALTGTLDGVLSGGIELLGEIVSHGRWSIVHPPDRDNLLSNFEAPPMAAQMAIPLGLELPVEARLGIETDSVREDYFVFSTELGTPGVLEAKWLAWSTRLDYRSSVESPASARAEQRVGVRLGGKDTVGVTGRIEDRNLALAASPLTDLAPAGEVFWTHRWLGGVESSLKVQQVLPDLQSIWLSEPASTVQLEANLRASLSHSAKVDLRGTAAQALNQFGIRLQFEFLLGTTTPRAPERIMLPEPSQLQEPQQSMPFFGILR